MSDTATEPRTKAIEDFDFIKSRLEQIKKEQEESLKTPATPSTEVTVASETDYCCGFSELSTGPRPIINTPGDYLGMYSDFAFEHVFEDYTLDENDEIVEEELIPFHYKNELGQVMGLANPIKSVSNISWYLSDPPRKIGDQFIKDGIEYILLPSILI